MLSVDHRSKFDRVIVNEGRPAVSLIITASQSLRNGPSNSIAYHAQIWIERVEENGLRRFYIEFNAPERGHERNKAFKGGTVKVYDGHIEDPRIHRCLGTWRIEAHKVNRIIEQARGEMQNPLGCPQAFNILGSESFFTRKQKACETSDPFLQAFQICNNKLFRWMYRTAEETIKIYPTDERYRYQNIIDDSNFIPWGGLLWGEKGVWLVDVAIDELRREVAFTEQNRYSNDMGGYDYVNQSVLWRDVLSKFSVQFIRDALSNAPTPNERQIVIQNMKENFQQLDSEGLIPRVFKNILFFDERDRSGIMYGETFARKIVARIEKKMKNIEH